MINEFGEEITEQEIKEVLERILKLPDSLIDELFYKCGLIYQDSELKALDKKYINDLRIKKENSEFFFTLIAETPKKDILENLEKIENEKS